MNYRPIKIREKKYHKKSKKFIQKYYIPFKSIKIFILFILLIIFVIITQNKFANKNNAINTYNKVILKNEEIIESNEYKKLNEIKNKITNTFFMTLLQEINIIKHIYTENIESNKKNKNIIHITSSINNVEMMKYLLLVSMNSLLMNCNKEKTFIIYHVLCTSDFNELSINIFKSLLKHYPYNIELIFYNMGTNFIIHERNWNSRATFFRLLTPLFIDSDRIIHLDCDTLIFTDLFEMYNLNSNDNYILGFLDNKKEGIDYLGINSTKYINNGVTLFNLKKIREDNKTFELIKAADDNIRFKKDDQDIINYILYPKIGRLPCKYGIWLYEYKEDLEFYLNKLRTKVPLEELEEAMKNPGIIHFLICSPKPWCREPMYSKDLTLCEQRNNCSCEKWYHLWHSFANKTDYYQTIVNLAKNYKHLL